MIFDNILELEEFLRIDSVDDYPQINAVLKPAVDRAIRDAVGEAWVQSHEDDPAVQQCACALLAIWFNTPEMSGGLTSGVNFLLTQLQARALEAVADG